MTGRLLPIIFLPAVCVWLAGCGKDPVQVESPEASGDKKLKNSVEVESPDPVPVEPPEESEARADP